MIDLIKKLENEETVAKGKPADSRKLSIANIEFKNTHNHSLPEDYLGLLEKFNGLSFEGARIFGISPEYAFFGDVVEKNNKNIENVAILGQDELGYLTYNYSKNEYQIVDIDFEIEDTTKSLSEAIVYFLKL